MHGEYKVLNTHACTSDICLQTGLFRQDAVGFVRSFAASDAETGGYSGSKCTHFSLHRFDADDVLISALCSKRDTSTVSRRPAGRSDFEMDMSAGGDCPANRVPGLQTC